MPFFRSSLLLAAWLAVSAPALAASARPTNFIVIMADDLGYGDVGFNGGKEIPTPHLDRLAAGGAVCTDAYVTFATCAPSRAGFITGRYPQRFGFERNLAWQPNNPATGLPRSETTLPETLRPLGYRSGLVGKWHLGAHTSLHPLERGFDEFFGHIGGGKAYFPEDLVIRETLDCRNEPDSYRAWLSRGREPVRTRDYVTEELTREALDFVRRQKHDPFFLFLAYNAPHGPLQAPSEELAKFAHIQNEKRRTYAAMVGVLDRGVGRLLDLLDELRLAEDTVVFFLSDNGGPPKDNASSNAPLRGGKASAYEGGIRVPFVVRWPGRIPAGLVYREPVSSLDIFATIAATGRVPARTERPLDGVDLLPLLRGEKTAPADRRIFLRMFDTGRLAMREGDYKIVRNGKNEPLALYHLATDLSESTNLADAEPQRLARMNAAYEAWAAELMEPAFAGLDMREWAAPQAPLTRK